MMVAFAVFTLCSKGLFQCFVGDTASLFRVTKSGSGRCINKWIREQILLWQIMEVSHPFPKRNKAAGIIHEQKSHPPDATLPNSNTNAHTNEVHHLHPATYTSPFVDPEKGCSWYSEVPLTWYKHPTLSPLPKLNDQTSLKPSYITDKFLPRN